MKVFSALVATETNTFVPVPTGWGCYEEFGVFHGDASTRDPQGLGSYMLALRQLLAAGGHELVESVSAWAQPLGRTVRAVYERLRDAVLADLAAAGPVDAVVLLLHGAMVADGYDDCEGDLIARVRALVGPQVPIGVELDLHCHYTALMHRSADVIVCYKEYPHIDGLLRLQELLPIVLGTAEGRLHPTSAVFDCKMVGKWHTTSEPMAGFVRRLQQVEQQPGVLSVSLGHGFPWADVAEGGAKLWVVTDNDPALAARLAEQLGRAFWDLREQTQVPMWPLDAALDHVQAAPAGPLVLADVADNAGGGALSDSSFVLRALLQRGLGDVALGLVWDLGAVQVCAAAGVGARLDLRLGGKCGPGSGDPVDLPVVVRAVCDAHWQPGLAGERSPLGRSVWVQAANGVDIVVNSLRSQVLGPEAFTGLGIDLAGKRLVVVKSAQHFHARFAPLAREVLYVNTPGSMDQDFARLPYRVRPLDYWPRVAEPQHGPALVWA